MRGGENMVDIEKQEGLRRFIDNDIYACQSTLVEESLNQGIFSNDDIENLYRPFDGRLLSPSICTLCKNEEERLDSETGECHECYEDTIKAQEIYEWWLISNWLAERLKKLGEPVLDNNFGTWWGRCCTGQAIYMDSVIGMIYDDVMSYTG